jgi:tRNA-2-methylthio-N6-dimethylallyladenosine synthase
VKSDRLRRLQALLSEQQAQFNSSCIGRTLPVLLERQGRYAGQLVGRSPYLQPVHLAGEELNKGDLVDAVIIGIGANSLSAQLAGRSG